MIEVQVQGERGIKRVLREGLLNGWIIVTGDLRCVEEFMKRYYPDSREDFVSHAIIYYTRGTHGVYPDITIISLAKKKRELGEILGDVERALRLHFKRIGDECKAEVKYANNIFPRLSIEIVVRKTLKDIEAMG